MMKSATIFDFEQLRRSFIEYYEIARNEINAERTIIIGLDYVGCTDGQRKHLHHLVSDISKQITWYGHKLTVLEVKRMLAAGLKKTKVIPGIDHESFVLIGDPTREMNYRDYADMILLATAFGNERGVRWSMTQAEMQIWRVAA